MVCRTISSARLGALGLSLFIGVSAPVLLSGTPNLGVQAQTIESAMTIERLDSFLREETGTVQGGNGQWQVVVGDRTLLVLADAANNRMRIFTPITAADSLTAQQVQSVLLANFHTALDARYALSEGVLVSSFVHPLDSLEEDYLQSAISQVATLADTFGTSYSSGVIGFGQSQPARLPAGDRLEI